jgi:hypothetical protein
LLPSWREGRRVLLSSTHHLLHRKAFLQYFLSNPDFRLHFPKMTLRLAGDLSPRWRRLEVGWKSFLQGEGAGIGMGMMILLDLMD